VEPHCLQGREWGGDFRQNWIESNEAEMRRILGGGVVVGKEELGRRERERGPRPVLLPYWAPAPPLTGRSVGIFSRPFLLDTSAVQSCQCFFFNPLRFRPELLHLSFLNQPTIPTIWKTNQSDTKFPVKSYFCSYISKLIFKKFWLAWFIWIYWNEGKWTWILI